MTPFTLPEILKQRTLELSIHDGSHNTKIESLRENLKTDSYSY